MRFPLCVGSMFDCAMFSFICALPSPTSAVAFASLFGWFTGTTAQSDFSNTYMSALRLAAFADRPSSVGEGVLEISRFSCMLFYQRARVLRLRRTGQPLACNAAAVLPSSNSEESRHPDLPAFRSSMVRPTNTPIYASSDTSRCLQQDSRSGWICSFLSCRGLAPPTTCRFIPALSGLPVIRQYDHFHYADFRGTVRLNCRIADDLLIAVHHCLRTAISRVPGRCR